MGDRLWSCRLSVSSERRPRAPTVSKKVVGYATNKEIWCKRCMAAFMVVTSQIGLSSITGPDKELAFEVYDNEVGPLAICNKCGGWLC